jgi:hypothetical protein
VFYAPPGTNVTSVGQVSSGCYSNPTNVSNGLIGASTYRYLSSSMTNDLCMQNCANRNATWAMTSAGVNCYCGTQSIQASLGTGTFVPSSLCTSSCGGNSSQICGGTYYSSVFNLTNAALKVIPENKIAGWQGECLDGCKQHRLSGFAETSCHYRVLL